MKEQTKFQKLKQAIKNPPPERLAAIEYRSHFLQIIGTLIICIVLIAKGIWYIIFAFIFTLGVSYSSGMSAYLKYKNIMELLHPEKAKDYEFDISPSRRRSKIINYVIGYWGFFILSIISVVITYFAINKYELATWILFFVYPLTILLVYILTYFFVIYYICYPIYKIKVKKEKNDS